MDTLLLLLESIGLMILIFVFYILTRMTESNMSLDSPGDENVHSYITIINANCGPKPMEQNGGYLNFDRDFEKFDIVYEINGEIFRENNYEDINDFCEFNVNINDATSLEEQETDEIFLDVPIQQVKKGILVDSRIFLSQNQWNTLMSVDDLSFCLVCDEIVLSTVDHASKEGHVGNLQKYKPLKKFDYSITRMINGKYHCAVCNETFEINSDKEHFDGEAHKDNMFNALNQHLHVNVDENNETISNGIHVDVNGTNYKDDSENSQVFGDNISKLPYNSLNMIIIPWIDKFYCMSCKIGDHISMKEKHCMECGHVENLMKCRVAEEYDCVLIRQIDMKYYHCGFCNLLVLISDIEDHIAYVHEDKSKNTDDMRSEKSNEIQSSSTNIDTINGFRNIKKYSGSYESSTVTESNESLENGSINQSKMSVLRELKELAINNVSPGYRDITLYEFGCNFRISFLAYNTLIRDTASFYCALCDFSIDEKVTLLHSTDFNHLRSLRAIQFDKHFGYNLLRVIHQRAHCSICNMQFHISSASHHVSTPIHLSLLKQAKNVIVPEVPTITENNNLPKQIDLNTTMHPPETDAQEIKIESNQNTRLLHDINESLESYNHQFIYLNFKNTFYKITFNSYNSLIVIGNGARYCFVCSVKVNDCLQEHVESAAHTKCMKKCKFIDKYNKHVLRQMFLTYHCCTCNLIFTKKHLNSHLSWSLEHIKTNKTIRKNDLKSGIKVIHAKTQNEQMYPELQEPEIKIIRHIKIKPKSSICIKKESKIVIVCSKVFKISWDSWHGLGINGNLVFCNLCNKNLKEYELNSHIDEECHSGALEKTFDKQFYPNLVRYVNNKMANCVICNLFICNKNHIILEHLNGKKHLVNYNNIIVNNDTNYCNESVLYL